MDPAADPRSADDLYPETCGIAPEFLKILVCPEGKAELRLENGHLVCTRCGPAFRIIDGIPELLVESAVLPPGVKSPDDLPCHKDAAPGDRAPKRV